MKRVQLALSLLVGLVVFLVLASVAYAQGTDPEANRNALSHLVEIVFQLLMVVLPIVATWLTHKAIGVFEKRSSVDVPLKIEKQIDEWIEKAIHFAAEKSRQKVKEKTAKLTGPEKLELAAAYVLSMAEKNGWIEWTEEKIRDKIEAALGTHRANGGVPKLDGDA